MNIELRHMILLEAVEQYEAIQKARHATVAEKTLAYLQEQECRCMIAELTDEAGS